MSIQLSDIAPYVPLASNALSILASAIEAAIAAHKSGDPDAALAALEAAVADASPVVASLADQVAAQRKAMDAAEDAKFPDAGLAATAAAIHAHLAAIGEPLRAELAERVK